MDEKDNQLNPEAESLNSTGEEKENEVSYEKNDNWKFDAEAPTLDNNIELGNGFEIEVKDDVTYIPPQLKNETLDKESNIVINKRALKTGLISAAAAILAALLIFFGIRFFALPNSNENMNPGNVALTVRDTKVSVGMYNLYYNIIVNNYKQLAAQGSIEIDFSKDLSEEMTTDDNGNEISWEEKFKMDTIKQLQYIVSFYEEAVKAGVTLTDDENESIDSLLNNLKKTASEAGSTLNKYISANYGEHIGAETIRKYYEQRYIFQTFYSQMNLRLSLTPDEAEQYFEENKENYIKFALLEMPFSLDDSGSSEFKTIEDVKTKMQSYCDSIKSVDDLKALVPQLCATLAEQAVSQGYFSDADSAIKALQERSTVIYSAKSVESNYGKEIVDWFKAPERADGDATFHINENYGIATIFLNTTEGELNNTELYSVRHILVSPNDDPNTAETATEAEWESALEEANKIVDEYNGGDKTETAFAALAEEYSDDTLSTSNGNAGYYGGEIKKTSLGSMVPEFEGWATDDARKYGDVGVVKSKYGYHIMYFIYDGPAYFFTLMDDFNNNKVNEFIDSVEYKTHMAFKRTTVVEPETEEKS